MGKRRKRLTMAKYATKYAAKRAAFNAKKGITTDTNNIEEPVVTEEPAAEENVGMEVLTTKDLMEESNSDVIVVKNKEPETKATQKKAGPIPEPQLQQVEIEKPKRKPAGLKQKRTRRKTTKTKKD